MKVVLAIIVLSTFLCPLGGIAASMYYKTFKSKKTDMSHDGADNLEDKVFSIFSSIYTVISGLFFQAYFVLIFLGFIQFLREGFDIDGPYGWFIKNVITFEACIFLGSLLSLLLTFTMSKIVSRIIKNKKQEFNVCSKNVVDEVLENESTQY